MTTFYVDILRQAHAASEAGQALRIELPNTVERKRLRMALYGTMHRSREEAKRIYDVTEAGWGIGQWDDLTILFDGPTGLIIRKKPSLSDLKIGVETLT